MNSICTKPFKHCQLSLTEYSGFCDLVLNTCFWVHTSCKLVIEVFYTHWNVFLLHVSFWPIPSSSWASAPGICSSFAVAADCLTTSVSLELPSLQVSYLPLIYGTLERTDVLCDIIDMDLNTVRQLSHSLIRNYIMIGKWSWCPDIFLTGQAGPAWHQWNEIVAFPVKRRSRIPDKL